MEGAPAPEPAPAAEPEPLDITVAMGDFLVLHEGHMRVATSEESLTMDMIARARETYSGPPKLIKVSVWL
jgi:hypothetical protein